MTNPRYRLDQPHLQLPGGGPQGGLYMRWQPDGTLWIADTAGRYICTTSDLDFVKELIAAEANARPDPSRPHLVLGAMEVIHPGQGEAREAEILARHEAQRAAFAQHHALEQQKLGQFSTSSGDDILAALGL